MRRCLGFVACLLTFSILVSLTVSATEYVPQTYCYNLHANGENYGGYLDGVAVAGASGASLTGTFSVPTNLDSRFKSLLLGAYYTSSPSTDVEATYKFVITITTGVSGSYTSSVAPVLYGTVMSGRNIFTYDGATMLSQYGDFEKTGDVYTFTYDGIPYDKIVGKTGLFIRTGLSSWESLIANEIYIVNSYFGLESYYNDDSYKSDVLTGLNNINDSLGNINDSIGDTNDKLDGVQDSLDNLIDDEINKSEDIKNNVNEDAEEAIADLPDFSESYSNILNNLTAVLYDMNTQSYIDLPDGNVNVLGQSFNIWGGETSVDLSEILNNEHVKILITIGRGISVLGCMATSVYWAFKIKEWISAYDEVSVPEIPFLPGGGKY